VATRQRDQAREVVARGDCSLRVGGGGEIDRDRPRQRGLIERIEVGQKSVGARGGEENRLAICGAGPGAIGWVERVWHQNGGRALARRDIAGGGDRREKQSLAAAVQRQNLGLGIDGAG